MSKHDVLLGLLVVVWYGRYDDGMFNVVVIFILLSRFVHFLRSKVLAWLFKNLENSIFCQGSTTDAFSRRLDDTISTHKKHIINITFN